MQTATEIAQQLEKSDATVPWSAGEVTVQMSNLIGPDRRRMCILEVTPSNASSAAAVKHYSKTLAKVVPKRRNKHALHITLAYPIREIPAELVPEIKSIQAKWNSLFRGTHIRMQTPRVCTFQDMTKFVPIPLE